MSLLSSYHAAVHNTTRRYEGSDEPYIRIQKGGAPYGAIHLQQKYEYFAIRKLESQNIKYVIQPVGNDRWSLYFGREECLNAIRIIVTRPLNLLTPEEDFMLGAMLGYDICAQCERYCELKDK